MWCHVYAKEKENDTTTSSAPRRFGRFEDVSTNLLITVETSGPARIMAWKAAENQAHSAAGQEDLLTLDIQRCFDHSSPPIEYRLHDAPEWAEMQSCRRGPAGVRVEAWHRASSGAHLNRSPRVHEHSLKGGDHA